MDEATLLSSFRMFLLRVLLIVNYSPPSRCTRLEEGASIRRSLVSRLRGVKFTGRFLTVQTLQTILCSELTPASQPVLCKVILYSQYIIRMLRLAAFFLPLLLYSELPADHDPSCSHTSGKDRFDPTISAPYGYDRSGYRSC